MRILAPTSVEAAHRAEQPTDDQIDHKARLRRAALDDLCDKMMNGESWPPHSRSKICLSDILLETDSANLDDIIRTVLFSEGVLVGGCYLHDCCEEIVANYLRGTHWHEQRIAEMHEEERE